MEELKPTTQEERQEWMTLKTDATPTPYFVVDHPAAWTIQTKPGGAGECVARNYGDSGKGNANYLVAAANALPRLVADVERLETDAQTVAHLRSVRERIADGKAAGAGLSDAEVAGRVRMLDRNAFDHEMVCVIGRDRIIALADENKRLREALEDVLTFFPGECRCHEGYTSRGLEDPNCTECEMRAELTEARAALSAGKEQGNG